MSTLVYRYGIASPHENAAVVLEQMRLAREYRCDLVRIERGRRAAVRRAQAESSEELRAAVDRAAAADAECARLAGAIKEARKRERRRAETAGMRADLAAARERLKGVRGDLRRLRARYAAQCSDCRKAEIEEVPCPHATPEARELRVRVDEIDGLAGELIRSARRHSGLAWGTYLVVDRAMGESRKAPMFEPDGVTPHDPPFPDPRSPDAVAVQIQSTRPLSVEGAQSGKSGWLSITRPPWPEEWLAGHRPEPARCRPQGSPAFVVRDPDLAEEVRLSTGAILRVNARPRRDDPFDPVSTLPQPSARRPAGTRPDGTEAPASIRPDGAPARWVRDRAARHGEVRMRVGRDGEVAAWRLDMHRPLPDGQVTWAIVKRHPRGPHCEWSLHLTVDARDQSEPRGTGAAAVDVGWRLVNGELRVAAWRDDAGEGGELRLTRGDLRALKWADEVRSERDSAFDLCKIRVKAWLDKRGDLPGWMRDAAARMPNWRRQSRMVALLDRWERERVPYRPDEVVVLESVRAWALADHHLWAEQEARRAWALRRRRDKYREWAARMVRRYGAVVLEQFDLRAVAERAQVGHDVGDNEHARTNRHLASVSELRGCLVNAARGRGLVVSVRAADSTRTHAACGAVEDRDVEGGVVVRCAACGESFDQDMNAADVLLARYLGSPGDAKVIGGAPPGVVDSGKEDKKKKSAKWDRARRMGKKKKDRVASGRR